MPGPAEWVHPFGPPGGMFLAGRRISCVKSMEIEPGDPFASIVPYLYGGGLFQTTPELAGAPIDLEMPEIRLELTESAEEEHHNVLRARALSRREPIEAVVPAPVCDRWIIEAGKTLWTISRSFAFSLVPYNAGLPLTFPRVFIEETPGGSESVIELTKVDPSPPDVTEFFVDTSTDGYQIETADLADYAGRVLACRYLPKRLVRVGPIPQSSPEWNGMDHEVTLTEVLQSRDWSA